MQYPGRTHFLAVSATALCLCSRPILAAEDVSASSIIDASAPDLWAQKVISSGDAKKIPWIRSLSIVESMEDKTVPTFVSVNEAAFNKLGYLTLISADDARYTMLLNKQPISASEDDAVARNLFALLKTDAAIVTGGNSDQWQLVVLDAKNSKVKVVANGSAPADATSPESIQKWTQKALGYDGIILAIQDDLILVITSVGQTQIARQAAVITDSAKASVVNPKSARAAAIIEKVASKGPYAIFKRILASSKGDSDVVPGGKILFNQD